MFKKGQSIVEYVLVLAAIVIAIGAFLTTFIWGTGGSLRTTNTTGLVGLYESRIGTNSAVHQALDSVAADLGLN